MKIPTKHKTIIIAVAIAVIMITLAIILTILLPDTDQNNKNNPELIIDTSNINLDKINPMDIEDISDLNQNNPDYENMISSSAGRISGHISGILSKRDIYSPEDVMIVLCELRNIIEIENPLTSLKLKSHSIMPETKEETYTFEQVYNDIPVYDTTAITIAIDPSDPSKDYLEINTLRPYALSYIDMGNAYSIEDIKVEFRESIEEKESTSIIYAHGKYTDHPCFAYKILSKDKTTWLINAENMTLLEKIEE